ncbi:ER membrane protein complex subunit 8/9-like protein [Thalictrum thalictroides]|uniref:ER membrane protein complex subunit 8/9-like protein n=1 Tax=Thalictrum thalictroides TaxID=46969 RepID=A0A7J6V5Q9_THATH|nr:ER membrane protein complex subunit 8/9-like protein [Thalictrum thalictroides]
MGGELKYQIGQNAYIKSVLHAIKHKTSAVNGILLGRLLKDEVIEISDAIPLSHSQIGLLPTLEIALIQLDNTKLEALSKGKDRNPVVQLYTRDLSKSWKQAGSGGSAILTLKEPSANLVLLDHISSENWQAVVDFDDHLDDISKDWLNPNLFK